MLCDVVYIYAKFLRLYFIIFLEVKITMKLSIIISFLVISLSGFFVIEGLQLKSSAQKLTAKLSSWGFGLRIIASTGISLLGIGGNGLGGLSFQPLPATAAIANLADVGIKEFLVKDGRQFLRLTIPLADHQKFGKTKSSELLKIAQENLELPKLRFEQVGFTNPSAWSNSLKDINIAITNIKSEVNTLTSSLEYPNGNDPNLLAIVNNEFLPTLQDLTTAVRNKDFDNTLLLEEKSANLLAQLRLAQIPKQQLPFTIPEEFQSLPQLRGRATIEMILEHKKGFRFPESLTSSAVPTIPILLTVDGYHTPITAGNFVDLVNKKFYNNMIINDANELTVQTGKISNEIDGYIDPTTKTKRTIPLELFYKNDQEPVYDATSDDDLRATDTMALPFQAYGALGMGRDIKDVDSGSSQFFFLKWLQALNPPGRNTIDGSYSCFGYVIKNEDFLGQLETGDKILSARVIDGLENLIIPK